MLVKDWMTEQPTSVRPETTVLEARGMLQRLGFHHLPVVEHGWLVGVLSDRDVCGHDRDRVRSVMSSPVHVVAPGDDLRDVASLLVTHRIHGVPVADHGLLVGILTATDCLRALVDSPLAAAREGPA